MNRMDIFGVYVPSNYIVYIYIFHIVMSLAFAVGASLYVAKRYVSRTQEAKEDDEKRYKEIAQKSSIFKMLFQISLHRYNPFASLLFFFLFNISIPLLGYCATIWVAYYLVHVKYEHKVINTNMLNLDEFELSFLTVERIFGEGSMSNVILAEDVPKSKKLKALSSLSSNISPMTLRIIKQTLSSKNDEIRMYGYAIINKWEKKLNEDINIRLEIYGSGDGEDAKRFEAAKELAFFYWEMVYAEISHESLRESFIKEVVKYVSIAKEYYHSCIEKNTQSLQKYEDEKVLLEHKEAKTAQDLQRIESLETITTHTKVLLKNNKDTMAKLYILMGRVYMVEKKYEEAIGEFTMAQEVGVGDFSFVLPYLAEIYFTLQKYNIAKSIMNQAKNLRLNPKLYPIVQQWSVS